MDLARYIGAKIKFYRKQANLTQTELAKMVGTGKATISNYETGYRSPQQDTLFSLAEALNISIDNLFPNEPKEREIVVIYDKLDANRQLKVLAFAEKQLEEQDTVGGKIISINKIKELYAQYQTDEENVDIYGGVSAGTGVEIYEDVVETIPYPAPIPAHDIALRVHGDSMAPLYQNGDIIFVNKTHEINHGQIGVFILNGQGFLKKFYKDYDNVKLVSVNKNYGDITLTEHDRVELVGTVIL